MRRVSKPKPAQRTRDKRKPRRRPQRRISPVAVVRMLAVIGLGGLVAVSAWWWRSGEPIHAWRSVQAAVGVEAEKLSLALGFALREVLVTGRKRTPAAVLTRTVGIRQGAPILSLDLDAAKKRIEELPWVRETTVRRLLPGTLQIALTERTPLARWQNEGKIRLIDTDGEAIPVKIVGNLRHLPLVVGPGAADHASALIDALKEQPELAGRVVAAIRISDRRWDLKLKGDIKVYLPERGVGDALRRLADAERTHGLLERNVTIVDLRLPGKMVVRTRTNAGANDRPIPRNTSEKST